jgi:nitrogen regulatory protein P-II 1
MKKIEAIIRPAKVREVCSALDRIGHPGVMVTEIEGHGKQHGLEQTFHGKKFKVEMLPKAKIQLVVKDEEVEKITKAIKEAAFTGNVGDGKVFIYPVEDVLRIRTGEKGEDAI